MGVEMKLTLKFFTVVVALSLLGLSVNVHAKRLGGGQSVGKQSSHVTQRDAAPSPNAPKPGPAASPNSQTPAAAPAPAPRGPWGAMLGGIAAGLGLAWLAHSMGFGAEFGEFLMLGLLALVIMAAVAWVMRRRSSARNSAYAYEGATQRSAAFSPDYRPENVGNDASARPWEYQPAGSTRPQSTQGVVIGSAIATPPSSWVIPDGFDVEGFVSASKVNFVDLQAAWDRADLDTLRAMMTDAMLEEIRQQLADRASHTGGALNRTEVVMIEAKLLGIEDLGQDYMASVEFSGMIREEPSAGSSPFREVWNLVKPKLGNDGWLVAGVQALQ
jgi:predicted lipid-binding transport protein (Tim44 family)